MILSQDRAITASSYLTQWDNRQKYVKAGEKSQVLLTEQALPLIEEYVRSLIPNGTFLMSLRTVTASTATRISVTLHASMNHEYVSSFLSASAFDQYPALTALAVLMSRHSRSPPPVRVDLSRIPGVDDDMLQLARDIPKQLDAAVFLHSWYYEAMRRYNIWQLDEAGVFTLLEREPPAFDKRPKSFPVSTIPGYLRQQMRFSELQYAMVAINEACEELAEFIGNLQVELIGHNLFAMLTNTSVLPGIVSGSYETGRNSRLPIMLPCDSVNPENSYHTLYNTCRLGKPNLDTINSFVLPISTPTLALSYTSSTWDDTGLSVGARSFYETLTRDWVAPEYAAELEERLRKVDTLVRESYRAYCLQSVWHTGKMNRSLPEAFPHLSKEFRSPMEYINHHELDGIEEFSRVLLIAKLLRD